MKARVLYYEKELKELLRAQLDRIEPGLVEADNGQEREVATGRIDITARDAQGHFVVIELKVGPCPVGALEQVLGYSADIEEETGAPCRAVLVASQFSERIQAAAKRTRDLHLVCYEVCSIDIGDPATV